MTYVVDDFFKEGRRNRNTDFSQHTLVTPQPETVNWTFPFHPPIESNSVGWTLSLISKGASTWKSMKTVSKPNLLDNAPN